MSINYQIELVERPVIRDFIEKHHYSHNINGLMSSYCFAMYDQDNNMVGAMIYGNHDQEGKRNDHARRPTERTAQAIPRHVGRL